MSTPHQCQLEPLFKAAKYWKQRCLLGGESLFHWSQLWQLANIEEALEALNDSADSTQNFYKTLECCISKLPPDTALLMVEVLWVLLLPQKRMTPQKKRHHLDEAAAWVDGNGKLHSPVLDDQVLQGLAGTPRVYNIYLNRGLNYLLEVYQALFCMEIVERKQCLENAENLAHWLDEQADENNHLMRNILLYLLFPDNFAPVFDIKNRKKIIQTFAPKVVLKGISNREVDIELDCIRQRLEKHHGSPIDFVNNEVIYAQWSQPAKFKPCDTAGMPIEYPGLKDKLN